eukprot:TRINITY_DN6131_c0_g1_i2.p1 TRINITY_DN6131_c0_g1~~TRINITY_DN6131_c0_g1_i2.p1  ORF type:complete len:542 (-),score=99.75 TRINITY_DN6131_c0_g1_i2:112-1737(-)
MPEKNWMNDPNGPVYYKGYYHLFFQYNPNAPIWGDMHWGHAVSKDLAHWQILPIALFPDQPYDTAGAFSGSITIGDDGTPIIMYTGQGRDGIETQCVAIPSDPSDPLLTSWVKPPYNPVILTPPQGVNPTNFRDDTTAWKINGVWYVAIGAELNGVGAVLVYASTNFKNFSYVGPLWTNKDHGYMWECPDFYPIGNQYVLKYSADPETRDYWTIGSYNTTSHRFTPTSQTVLLDYGKFYASKTFFDPVKNRRILWGWVAEEDTQGPSRGWQSVQSIPRVIDIDRDLDIPTAIPIEELSLLRINPGYSQRNVNLEPNKPLTLPIKGDSLEIMVSFDLKSSDTFGLKVRESADGNTFTSIFFQKNPEFDNTDLPGGDYRDFYYNNETDEKANIAVCYETCQRESQCKAWTYVRKGDPGSLATPRCSLKNSVPGQATNTYCVSGVIGSTVNLDRSVSGTDGDKTIQGGILPMKSSDVSVNFHVFIDRSIIEVFAQNGRARITSRVYPSPLDLGVSLFSASGTMVSSLDVWTMGSSWTSFNKIAH